MTGSPNRRLPILLYHSVSTTATRSFRPWTVTPILFRRHLSHLADAGYTPMTVGHLVRSIAAATPQLPARPVVLTFDDGFTDFHTTVQPALARLRFPSTLYVSTGYVGSTARWLDRIGEGTRPVLSATQVRELAASGVEIGAHGCTHRPLDELPAVAARREIVHSKLELEDVLGEPVTTFAYPHGHAGRRERALVEQAGFTSAVAVRHAMATPRDDVFGLARIVVRNDTSVDALAALLEGWGLRRAPFAEPLRTTAWRTARHARRLIAGATR